MKHRINSRIRRGDPQPNHFGTVKSACATYSQHNTRWRGVFPGSALSCGTLALARGLVAGRGQATALSLLIAIDGLRFVRDSLHPFRYVLHSMAAGLRPTRWDSIIFYRAGLVAAIALAMAWLVTAFTDEGGIGWQERAGRTIPLTPICAAIGAWGALAPVRARGEARALEALGRSLGQIGAAAVAGGAALALGAALAMQSAPGIDVAGFYPTALRPTAWRWEQGTFVNTVEGVRIDREGSPARWSTPFERPRTATIPRGGRAAAAVATAMAGVALPMLLAQLLLERPARGARSSRKGNFARATWQPTLASAAAIVASVMFFQASAARLVSAWLAAVPPGLLLGFAVARHWRRN